jgi:hypothetical protein
LEAYGSIPFRFNPLWAQDPSFLELVSHSWCHWVHGSPIYIWEKKVKKLKYALKYWAKSVYNSPLSIIPKLLKEMESIQYRMETEDVPGELLQQDKFSFQAYHKAIWVEEESWCLKSLSLWLMAGDRNTKKFHKQAKSWLCKNQVKEITREDRRVVTTFPQIKEATFSHYSNLYFETDPIRIENEEVILNNIP